MFGAKQRLIDKQKNEIYEWLEICLKKGIEMGVLKAENAKLRADTVDRVAYRKGLEDEWQQTVNRLDKLEQEQDNACIKAILNRINELDDRALKEKAKIHSELSYITQIVNNLTQQIIDLREFNNVEYVPAKTMLVKKKLKK